MSESALPKSFQFEVVKPDGTVLSTEAEECLIPGALGNFGVLPGHTPLLTLVGTGEVMWRLGTTRGYLAVSGGFCEVRPDHVTVLADVAEKVEDIDLARAGRARAEAEEELNRIITKGTGEEITAARDALALAELRIKVGGRQSGAAA